MGGPGGTLTSPSLDVEKVIFIEYHAGPSDLGPTRLVHQVVLGLCVCVGSGVFFCKYHAVYVGYASVCAQLDENSSSQGSQ